MIRAIGYLPHDQGRVGPLPCPIIACLKAWLKGNLDASSSPYTSCHICEPRFQRNLFHGTYLLCVCHKFALCVVIRTGRATAKRRLRMVNRWVLRIVIWTEFPYMPYAKEARMDKTNLNVFVIYFYVVAAQNASFLGLLEWVFHFDGLVKV